MTPDDWTNEQRVLYARVYRHILSNPRTVMHPSAPQLNMEQLDALAHNAAYLAAELTVNDYFMVVDETDGTVISRPGKLDS